jgi:hypothetical protein
MATTVQIITQRFFIQNHIDTVRKIVTRFCAELACRGIDHDASKMENPEIALFAEQSHRLAENPYGSNEYYESMDRIRPAIDHHYSQNRHHPQHHENGVDGMNLLDLVEMVIDWKASGLVSGGDYRESVTINALRFNLSPQLVSILLNTADFLEKAAGKPFDGD